MDRWLENLNVIRVISLLIGILLWAVVQANQTLPAPAAVQSTTRSHEITGVGIEAINLDEKRFVIRSIEPSEVSLSLRGTSAAIDRVSTTSYKVQLDLSAVEKGNQYVPLKAIGFPSGVDVTINPNYVKVTVEELQTKEMPVTIDVIGQVMDGYRISTPIVSPGRVHVTAPESEFESIAYVRAEVDVTGEHTTVKREVTVSAYNIEGQKIEATIAPVVVEVEVPITVPFKIVPLQIKFEGELPKGFSLASYQQSIDEVTVFAPQDVLDKLAYYDAPRINLAELREDRSFNITLPLHESIEQVEPKAVTVDLKIVPSQLKTLEAIKVNAIGGTEDIGVRFITPDNALINVNLSGAEEVLDKMNADHIQAYVDISSLPFGTHELPVMFHLPSFVHLADEQNLLITVQIYNKNAENEETVGENELEPTDSTVLMQLK